LAVQPPASLFCHRNNFCANFFTFALSELPDPFWLVYNLDMDDQLRRFPTVLSALGRRFLTDPPPGLDNDGLVMLREALAQAFIEVCMISI